MAECQSCKQWLNHLSQSPNSDESPISTETSIYTFGKTSRLPREWPLSGIWLFFIINSKNAILMNSDSIELLAAFTRENIRYLIVGGYAVSFHAEPRYTKDLDILIATTHENAQAL